LVNPETWSPDFVQMIATLEGLSVRGASSAIADPDTATMVIARTIILPLSRQKRCGPIETESRRAHLSPFLAAIGQENVTAMCRHPSRRGIDKKVSG
jgi:hypothetical protein